VSCFRRVWPGGRPRYCHRTHEGAQRASVKDRREDLGNSGITNTLEPVARIASLRISTPKAYRRVRLRLDSIRVIRVICAIRGRRSPRIARITRITRMCSCLSVISNKINQFFFLDGKIGVRPPKVTCRGIVRQKVASIARGGVRRTGGWRSQEFEGERGVLEQRIWNLLKRPV